MIVLVGFMGAGKTTVGRLLAAELGVAFVDADEAIEAAHGASIPEIFRALGEPGFRRIEAETVVGLLSAQDVVLALGGGALGSERIRDAVGAHEVVLLDVPLAEALARVGGDENRPMLRDPDLPAVYEGRQQVYRDTARHVVGAAGLTPEEVAAAVLAALGHR